MLALLALTACLPAPSTIADSDPYIWQGWIYGDLPAEDAPALDASKAGASSAGKSP